MFTDTFQVLASACRGQELSSGTAKRGTKLHCTFSFNDYFYCGTQSRNGWCYMGRGCKKYWPCRQEYDNFPSISTRFDQDWLDCSLSLSLRYNRFFFRSYYDIRINVRRRGKSDTASSVAVS